MAVQADLSLHLMHMSESTLSNIAVQLHECSKDKLTFFVDVFFCCFADR